MDATASIPAITQAASGRTIFMWFPFYHSLAPS